MRRGSLVTITVAEDRHYTLAHEIIIEPADFIAARTEAQVQGRSWKATRISTRGVDEIRSDTCPTLRTVALSFGDLPDVPITPMPFHLHAEAEPLPPTRKDGFVTQLRFPARTGDGSYAVIEITQGNVYAQWGHDAVSTLLECWEPLTPGND